MRTPFFLLSSSSFLHLAVMVVVGRRGIVAAAGGEAGVHVRGLPRGPRRRPGSSQGAPCRRARHVVGAHYRREAIGGCGERAVGAEDAEDDASLVPAMCHRSERPDGLASRLRPPVQPRSSAAASPPWWWPAAGGRVDLLTFGASACCLCDDHMR